MSQKCNHENTSTVTNSLGGEPPINHTSLGFPQYCYNCYHYHHCCHCYCPTCGFRTCSYSCYCCCHPHHHIWPPYTITTETIYIGAGDTTYTWTVR